MTRTESLSAEAAEYLRTLRASSEDEIALKCRKHLDLDRSRNDLARLEISDEALAYLTDLRASHLPI